MKTRLAMIIAPVLLGAGLAMAIPATAQAGSGHHGHHHDYGHYRGHSKGHYKKHYKKHYKRHARGYRKAHYRGYRKGHYRGYRKGYRRGRRSASYYRRYDHYGPPVHHVYPRRHGVIHYAAPGIGVHLYFD